MCGRSGGARASGAADGGSGGALGPGAFRLPIKAREGVAGRDATDPQLLVALWLYACVRGIGSARELARQCQENATFRWLCGGVTVNHRLLSDFRTDHAEALDGFFTQVIASLVDQGVVQVSADQPGRDAGTGGSGGEQFSAGSSFAGTAGRSAAACGGVASATAVAGIEPALTARQRGARERAARERQERLQQAIAQLPEVKQRHEPNSAAGRPGSREREIRRREPRVSTTDAEARVMKMPNGGFNPAANVQLAADTASRAIVGVEVSKEGSDAAGLSAPMRAQVEQRTGGTVEEHLLDGGYVRYDDIDQAQQQGVALFMAPKGARNPARRGHELDPKPGDSEAVKTWKQRMRSEEGKQIYKQRAATSETVNADLRTHRGLGRLSVRGLAKIRCVALGCALAYNIMHFAKALLA